MSVAVLVVLLQIIWEVVLLLCVIITFFTHYCGNFLLQILFLSSKIYCFSISTAFIISLLRFSSKIMRLSSPSLSLVSQHPLFLHRITHLHHSYYVFIFKALFLLSSTFFAFLFFILLPPSFFNLLPLSIFSHLFPLLVVTLVSAYRFFSSHSSSSFLSASITSAQTLGCGSGHSVSVIWLLLGTEQRTT